MDVVGEFGWCVYIKPPPPFGYESHRSKDKVLVSHKVVWHRKKSDLGSVSGRGFPCLARQLTIPKTICSPDRVVQMSGSTRGDHTGGINQGSGPHDAGNTLLLL